MIDLHLHLDGSLTPQDAVYLAEIQNIDLKYDSSEQLKAMMKAPDECKSLNEYLERFTLPVSLLQSAESIYYAVKSIAGRLDRQGLVYAEIRFAPQLHTKQGMSQRQAVKAAAEAIKKVNSESESLIMAQLILCCMRGDDNFKENMETVETAAEFLGNGVCALDLAGAEALYETRAFSDIFKYASNLKIPFTIHAGEAAGPLNIWQALELGAARIGHGVTCVKDEKLVDELISRKIPLEMCITSNVQTKAVQKLSEHPVYSLLKRGACVTINTDNMTVSDTNMEKETNLLKDTFKLDKHDMQKLMHNSANATFVNEDIRKKIHEKIKGDYLYK